MIEELGLGLGRSCVEILIGNPAAIERPAKIRCLPDEIHGGIDRLSMKLGDLRGIIRKSDVEMLVSNHGNGPFLGRSDLDRSRGEISEPHSRLDISLPLRYLKLQPLLSEFVRTAAGLFVGVPAHYEFNGPGLRWC